MNMREGSEHMWHVNVIQYPNIEHESHACVLNSNVVISSVFILSLIYSTYARTQLIFFSSSFPCFSLVYCFFYVLAYTYEMREYENERE